LEKEQKLGKIAFKTIGCKLSFADTAGLAREIEEHGFEQVMYKEEADIYVINSCFASDKAESKFRLMIEDLKLQRPNAKIVVFGCYAEQNPDKIASFKEVDMVLGNIQKSDIYNFLKNLNNYPNKLVVTQSEWDKIINNNLFIPSDIKPRPVVKISEGCDYFCSYCKLSVKRDIHPGKSIKEIKESVNELVKSGVKEIVINGFENPEFRKTGKLKLVELLSKLEKIKGLERIRLAAIEPDLVSNELIEYVANSKKVLPYFHLNIHSLSNRILRGMDKSYRKKDIIRILNKINAEIYDVRVGLDIIV